MRTNKLFIKRTFAYLIDIIIVTTISTFIIMVLPKSTEYAQDYNKKMTEITKNYKDKVISDSVYEEQYININYDYSLNTIQGSIITVAISIVYFVIFAYFNDGQTIGKKFLKLKIVPNKKRKLKVNNLLFRSLIINSVLMNIISITLLLTVTKENYIKLDNIFSTIFSFVIITSLILMSSRKDERGLQDFLGNTKVVLIKNSVEDDIKEAEIVKEKDSYIEEIKKEKIESFDERKED